MFFGALGTLVLGFAAVALLYFQGVIGLAQSADGSVQAAETPSKVPSNVFADHIKQAGMKRCTTAFPLLGEMLVTGSQYAVRSHWNAQAIVGLSYKTPGYEGPAGGFVFAAPLPNGGCEGAMLRVAPFPRACKDVLPLLPPGSTAADTLSGVQTYNLGKGQGQGMLIPAGSASCIAISTTAIAQ
ncbi:hypothetical protein CN233_31580 [Sinorhizobium meliloti]|nr:hypothetical protein [Sinorhizobium meliloti]MDW9460389.1 hypothetical protein [Sinorhizobium meliloti]MDW9653969.1 hypothetical protein [Sinorhizobium meliloti]MDW9914384.1 hypothetical protein [Sinorhizobium meliloti]MDW9937850.1 hypothetical protein [Sinorhizobium meliloti]